MGRLYRTGYRAHTAARARRGSRAALGGLRKHAQPVGQTGAADDFRIGKFDANR